MLSAQAADGVVVNNALMLATCVGAGTRHLWRPWRRAAATTWSM